MAKRKALTGSAVKGLNEWPMSDITNNNNAPVNQIKSKLH